MSVPSITHNTVYLPNILLDETNYPTWLFRLQTFLGGQHLYGFVDGSTPCPPQYVLASDGSTSTLSTEYDAWKTQDQNVINLLGQTLSTKAMSCVVGSQSAQDMWTRLKNKFAAPSRQNILQLKSNLQNLKKGSDSVETYLEKIKDARDALETVGVFLDDEDVVVTVLRGLPPEYAAIRTVIRAQFVSSTIAELKTLLQATESDIEADSQVSAGSHLTAMLAQNNSPSVQSSPVSSVTKSPSTPPGFSTPVSTPASSSFVSSPAPSSSALSPQYFPIPAMPYGFPYNVFDPSLAMAGFYAGGGRSGGRNHAFGNNSGGGNTGFGNNSGGANTVFGGGRGMSFPNRNNTFGGGNSSHNGSANGNGGFPRNNGGSGNSLTCQLCGKVGHGAKTCRTLSNFNVNGASSSTVECQYCGRPYHTADKCFHIIGFPGQQSNNEASNAAALLAAAANSSPQFWLADSGATNHMTSEMQLLQNVAPYTNSDSVQIGDGQGARQDSVQRTE